MRYSPESLPLFYQVAWEHELKNVCVAVRPKRSCAVGQRRYHLSTVPHVIERSAHIFVQADVAQNGGKPKRQEREVDSLDEAASLVHELNRHTMIHNAVICQGGPPRSKAHTYYFYSERQKRDTYCRNGRRLPAPFTNHRPRRK